MMVNKWQIYQQMARVIRWMHVSHEQRRTQMIILFNMIERDCGEGEHIIAETLKAILTFASVKSLHDQMTHSGVKAALRLFEDTCGYWIYQLPKMSMAQKTQAEELAERAEQRQNGTPVDTAEIPF